MQVMRSWMLMAGTFLSLAAVAAAPEPLAESSDAYGPFGNEADQYRHFWSGPWQAFADAGFNSPANAHGLSYDYAQGRIKWSEKAIRERKEELARAHATGIGYAERFNNVDCNYLAKVYPIVDPKGLKGKPYPDMTNPECYAACLAATRTVVASLPDDPAFRVAQVASERHDLARPSFTPVLAERWRTASGGKPLPPEVQAKTAPHYRNLKGFPISRIVPEDDPILSFYRWYWRDGDNWNRYCSDASDLFRGHFSHRLATMYDPVVRMPPIWGSGGTVTFASQWVYLVPDPYVNVFSISEQQAMVRGRPGQGVWSMIQGITYSRDAAPGAPPPGTRSDWYEKFGNVRYLTTPPDYMREGMWGIFARKVDGHLHYAFQALLPQPDPKPNRKTGKIKWPSYVCTNTNTYHVIGELFARVGVPLGPLLRTIPERAPQVAFLESFATYVFAHRASFSSQGAIFNRGGLAVRANVQPHVLYEEDLANGGVPTSVKVILAPQCEVLSRKAFEALRAWQLKGGVIVADESLPPALMRDYVFPEIVWKKEADADGAAVARAADELNAIVSKVCTPHANVVRGSDAYTWVRTAGSADYLFVINDRRVRGDYVGQWGLMREKGVANAVTVSLERTAGAVYDLERHRPVPFVCRKGRTEIDVSLAPSDGALLMAVDAPLGKLSVGVAGGEVMVSSENRDVLIPIEVTRTGEKPFYGVIRDGWWKHAFERTDGLRVRNLATGAVVSAAEL